MLISSWKTTGQYLNFRCNFELWTLSPCYNILIGLLLGQDKLPDFLTSSSGHVLQLPLGLPCNKTNPRSKVGNCHLAQQPPAHLLLKLRKLRLRETEEEREELARK